MKRKDFLTPQERSKRMSLIKGKGTKPEKMMARILRREKIRYVGHRKDLPGCPDFALKDSNVAIFVDGGFWHGRGFADWCNSLNEYWYNKISGNMQRDKRNFANLRRRGWSVVRIWEDDLRKRHEWCVSRIRRAIQRAEARDNKR